METFFVKEVLGKDLKVGDEVWDDGDFKALDRNDITDIDLRQEEHYFLVKVSLSLPNEGEIIAILEKNELLQHPYTMIAIKKAIEWIKERSSLPNDKPTKEK